MPMRVGRGFRKEITPDVGIVRVGQIWYDAPVRPRPRIRGWEERGMLGKSAVPASDMANTGTASPYRTEGSR